MRCRSPRGCCSCTSRASSTGTSNPCERERAMVPCMFLTSILQNSKVLLIPKPVQKGANSFKKYITSLKQRRERALGGGGRAEAGQLCCGARACCCALSSACCLNSRSPQLFFRHLPTWTLESTPWMGRGEPIKVAPKHRNQVLITGTGSQTPRYRSRYRSPQLGM